jgi:hypothetical protein
MMIRSDVVELLAGYENWRQIVGLMESVWDYTALRLRCCSFLTLDVWELERAELVRP